MALYNFCMDMIPLAPAVAVLTVSCNGLQFHPAQLRAFKRGRDRLWQQEIQNTLKYVGEKAGGHRRCQRAGEG